MLKVLAHADCDRLLKDLDQKLIGVVQAMVAARQSLKDPDMHRQKEATIELTKLVKEETVLRSRRDGIQRRQKDLKSGVADTSSAGRPLRQATVSRRSAAIALTNRPQGNI